ncbi:MAG: PKD domain-containing protein [Chitinispirillaceae bacterium]
MKCLVFSIFIGFAAILFTGCGGNDIKPVATAVTVSGSVTVSNEDMQQQKQVTSKMDCPPGSIIKTADSSFAFLLFGKHDTIYLSENTALKLIDSPQSTGNSCCLTGGLLFGRAFVTCRRSEAVTCSLFTPYASVAAHQARVAVEYYPDAGITIAKALTGKRVSIYSSDGRARIISSCRKVLARRDGQLSRSVSLSDKDITNLEQWVGDDIVDPLLAGTGCGNSKQASVNQPPVFVGEPLRHASLNVPFKDRLTAIDPESLQISYQLLNAPKDMSIDKSTGVLSYTPTTPGTFPVQVRAEDPQMNSVDLRYELTVKGLVTAVLVAPDIVSPGDTIHLSAYRSVNEQGTRKNLMYRFDTDGDGSWDVPSSGKFGNISSALATFSTEGQKKVSVEVKSAEGKIARKSRTIQVNTPPTATLICKPNAGTAGTRFQLDASSSSDQSGDSLKARWDLNGDMIWDYPENGKFGNKLTLDHMWDSPGNYTVTIEVRDRFGSVDTAATEVMLYEGISITSLQMPDTIAVNDSFTVICVTSSDSAVRAKQFDWNMDGDTVYEHSSLRNRTRHMYRRSGPYTVQCAVSDDKGGRTVMSREIFVVNSKAIVDAGGPYKAFVNDTITLCGSGSDPDNEITMYLWDLDNDSQAEHKSEQSAELKKVFSSGGTYTIKFGMQTDDGAIVWDKTEVTITNRPPQAHAGQPVTSRPGKKVTLQGKGSDPDGNIVTYRWDFDANGTWDWQSSQTGTTTHKFTEYTAAVFQVMDSDSAYSNDTVNIVICPEGMKAVEEGAFCVDKYEWPNKKGEMPMRDVTWQKAQQLCNSVGKRLCTGKEWQIACKGGKDKNSFPYGKHYDPLKCNSLGNKKVDNRAAKSGMFIECVNRYDLHDMSGNVAEWTSDGAGAVRQVFGGWWHDDQQRAGCQSFMPLESEKGYLHVGFRCCK